MSTSSSQIVGKLLPINIAADDSCIPPTLQELLKVLIDKLAVQIPGNPGDTFIIVSNQAPNATSRQQLWLATDLSGSPVALRKFVGARWVTIMGFGTPWIQEFLGDPNHPEEGWQPLDGTNNTLDTKGTWTTYTSTQVLYKAIFVG